MPFNQTTQQQQQEHGGFLMNIAVQFDSSSFMPVLDDDSSTSSTIAVACFQHQKAAQLVPQQQQHQQSSPFKMKHVHFNEADNAYYSNTSVVYKQDCKQLWYSLKDLHQFKTSLRNSIRQIVRNDRLAVKSSSTTTCYQTVLERAYEACCQNSVLTLQEEQDLERNLLSDSDADDSHRWGMERATIRSIATDCANRKRDLVNIVLQIQELAQSSAASSNNQHHQQVQQADNNNNNKLMRQASELLSRPSRLFAQQLAQAQARTSSAV